MGCLGLSVQQNLIFALHGFLGEASDWSLVQRELETTVKDKITWVAPNLFCKESSPIRSMHDVPIEFLNSYQKEFEVPGRKIFVGYSLGARLGMHFLEKYADRFDHFIFVSAHPGLQSDEEKLQRRQSDRNWSQLITEAGWGNFLQQWNSQPVFNSLAKNPTLEIIRFDLKKLIKSLDLWSLGQQSDMRSLLLKYQEKITWSVGTEDAKFFKIAEDLKQKKILLNFNRIFSAHRILFENPKSLATLIAQTFSKLGH